jgi:sec-independent protein translocase protein TatC
LLRPLPHNLKHITTFSPTEPFLVSLQIWLYSGIVLASPLIIYEFWAFVGPAFTPGEKRHILPVAFICAILFLGGVAFGYVFVLPRGLSVLLGWNSEFFNVQNRAKDYLSFVAWFLVAFGAVFEMPVIIVGAVRLGVVDRRFLRKNRKYAILINAAVAAIATPSQDAFSMLAMFIPLVLLYELAIVISRFFEPERRARRQAAQAQGGSP